MRFSEKLSRLTEGKNKQKLGKIAGLPVTAVSDYIAKDHIPRADKALKLAKVLGVDLSWLIDDSRDWPPPAAPAPIESALTDVPLGSLLRELARRYRLDTLDVLPDLVEAQETDWAKALAEAKSLGEGKSIPQSLARPLKLLGKISSGVMAVTVRYDIHIAADFRHHELPGSDRPPETLSFVAAISAFSDLFQKTDFAAVWGWLLNHKEVMEKLRIPLPIGPGQLFSIVDEDERRKLLLLSQKAKKE